MKSVLIATFFWKLLPAALVLGVVAFLLLSWFKYKAGLVAMNEVTSATADIADATATVADATVEMATSLHALSVYKGENRKENFVSSVLGVPDWTNILVFKEYFVVAVLLKNLIQNGWVVEKELEMEQYDGNDTLVVVSKDSDGDNVPEIMILQLKVEEPLLQFVRPKGDLDLTPYALDGQIEVASNIRILAGDCGVNCKIELRKLVTEAAKEATVTVEYFSPRKKDRIPIKVYSSANGSFIPDSIVVPPTDPAILGLSYNIKRKAANNSYSQYRLLVERFIKLVVETTCPGKDASGIQIPPRRFNIGMIGPGGSGKSYLLKALLEAGHAAGVTIVKASAAAFADFVKDVTALQALKALGEAGPTWLVIDEGNGLPTELTAALASVMDGLDSQPNLSVILATNRQADLENEELANLFRVGRVELFLEVGDLPPEQWKPLASALKAKHSHLVWTIPDDNNPRTLGQVYDFGQAQSLENIFSEMMTKKV